MAVLNREQLFETNKLWSHIVTEASSNIDKPGLHAAIQAIDDWFDKAAVKNSISNDIDAATSPAVLTASQKRKLVAAWMTFRFGRDK